MPRLLLFAPCERVILADDQTVSLITLVEHIRLGIDPSNAPPEVDATKELQIPFTWFALSTWTREEHDQDGSFYQQKLQLEMPDGTTPIELEVPLRFAQGKPNSRSIFRVAGFPVTRQTGTAKVKLLLKHVESDADWREVAAWPVLVEVPAVQTLKA